MSPTTKRLLDAWRDGSPDVSEFAGLCRDEAELAEVVLEDSRQRRGRSMPCTLRDYRALSIELKPGSRAAQGLLAEEFVSLAREVGVESARAALESSYVEHRGDVALVAEMCGFVLDSIEDADTGIEPGQRLGKYEFGQRLGRGSFGEVWLAWDTRLGRNVAVKLIAPGPEAGTRRAALEEARLAAPVQHPNVVEVYDVGELPSGWLCLEMELCADAAPEAGRAGAVRLGRTLAELRSEGAAGLSAHRRFARLMAQASRGVAAAHAHGVVHRDLKPANILVTPSDRVMVSDFGLATPALTTREAGPGSSAADTVRVRWRDRVVCGAPAYMAPEQARGENATPVSDVYGLGACLYFLLTGEHPYGPDTASGGSGHEASRALERVVDPQDAPRPIGPEVPKTLARICASAMLKDPKRRHQSALDLARDLEAWADRRPLPVLGPEWRGEPVTLFVRRHPVAVGAVVCGVAAFLALGGWHVARIEHARSVAEAERDKNQSLVDFFKETMVAARPDLGGADTRHRDVVMLAAGRIESSLPKDPRAASELLEVMGTTLLGYGDPRAVEALNRCAELRSELLGAEHPDTLDTQILIGILLRHFDRLEESVALLERVVPRRLAGGGAADENAWTGRVSLEASRTDLALRGGNASNLRSAAASLESLERDLAERFGAEHGQRGACLHNLARVRLALGLLGDAEAAGREAARIAGADNAASGIALDTLAQTLEAQHRFAQAIPLYEEAVRRKSAAYSADAELTLLARLRLAMCRVSMGGGEAESGVREAEAVIDRARKVLPAPDAFAAEAGPLLRRHASSSVGDTVRELLERLRVASESEPR